ncbi:NAD(P)H-hydrate dehydratase [Lentibacillus cibarius]|uniref:Bifunctional NAD(P)H-hydrate repair enzyme n=1 Tax=Lentibacillus cibarius TaxID=2583219 RepID=A0A5S3R7T6_9BACI|nr:NAD(P)H-hydrate dehydratase [Lentibacillus cibarius]TMN22563.1 NAD(P)H-hydrate dehydratase [Lentibacillus cibarius]
MYIVTAEEMYDMDHGAMNKVGIDGKLLMENAGRSIAASLKERVSKTYRILVLAGGGNNGGDGFVIARTLLDNDFDITVVQVVPDEKITGDALYHKQLFVRCGGNVTVMQTVDEVGPMVSRVDIVLDAIAGIGMKGRLREPLASVVDVVNKKASYVLSVDIPSGLPANEGISDFYAVQANETLITGFPKQSAFLEHTAPYYGNWQVVSFGLPSVITSDGAHRYLWTEEQFRKTIPERGRYSHKGSHGRGLAVGGSAEMPGSITMTIHAALRTGAGLVTAATAKSAIPAVASQCMEATYLALEETNGRMNNEVPIPFDNYDAIVTGMGMGRHHEARSHIRKALEEASCPLIVDADGLYHLKSLLASVTKRKSPVVLTPHPGEMAMLLDKSVPELLQKPFAYAKMAAEKYGVYIVLKGPFTIITTPDGQQTVTTTGNEGLAKGGSGDVLSGIILAMVLQDQPIMEALSNACFIHGKAADMLIADTHSVYDLLASDLLHGISKVYRTFV